MQSFATEISAEVIGHDSGKGKVVCAKKQNYKHQDEIYSEIKKTKISLLSIRLEEIAKALFKWLSKHQFQSNNSDQSQQEQTAQRTNQNSERLRIICSKCGESRAYKGANGLGSACHCLNYWLESFSRRSRNPLIILSYGTVVNSGLSFEDCSMSQSYRYFTKMCY